MKKKPGKFTGFSQTKEAMRKEVIPSAATISLETKTHIPTVISLSIDKIGAKRVLNIVKGLCLQNTLLKTSFPSSMFATGQDEEMADVVSALVYLEEKWDECSKKGMKILEAKVKKAQEKIARDMGDMHKEIR